tara:strand:+ start:2306 stop:2509 length:204 start_codon:yes stop_codon:yes gene_type:complete
MSIEYKFISDKSDEEKVYDLKTEIQYLEEKHKTESDKETTNDDLISSIETLISDKKTEYEALGGTYD